MKKYTNGPGRDGTAASDRTNDIDGADRPMDETHPTIDSTGPDDGRYAELDLADDAVVVYDRTSTHAWIQSDVTYPTDVPGETDSAVDRERDLAAQNAEYPVTGGGIDG